RIRLQASAADLLWARDKARARELFSAAMNDLAGLMSSIRSDDPQYYNRINIPAQLRQQLLQLIARRDPKLALDFLHATHQPPPPQQLGANYRQPDPDLVLELNLAEQVAAADPQQALRLAEETLNKGLSYNLTSVLDQLRQKNVEAANKLAGEIIQRLRPADFADNYGAANVAAYLLQATRPAESASNGQQIVSLPNPRQLQVDEQARRDLIQMMARALLNATSAQQRSGNLYSLVSALQQTLPEVDRYAPEQAAALRRRLDEVEQTMNPQAAMWRQYQPLMQNGTTDALLDAAASAPPEIRGQLYQAAVGHALNDGGLERARELVNARVKNKEERAQVLHELDQRALWQAAQQGDVEQTLRLLEHVHTTGERLNFMLNLARMLSSKGQTQQARRVVDEAANLLAGRAQNAEQFNLQLQVAQAYVPLAPTRAFEIVEARIDQLNELIAASAIVDGFGQDQFEQDELRMQNGNMLGSLIEQCNAALAALARTDFDRARADADRFQRTEARLQARLAIVQPIMSEQEQRNEGRPVLNRTGGVFSSGRPIMD
ncbi:MAG TPA: hypothetical protein VE821_14320, partial [Pyrinomonadaceae bacterium]|nr:hypothetical protein [Pyrinomonadaceae bacterium]